MNVWKCKLIFPTDTLQQKIEITDLKPFLAAENTSVLIILSITVCVCNVYVWNTFPFLILYVSESEVTVSMDQLPIFK